MPRIEVVRGDITTLDVEGIVNAANEALAPGGGVCGAIHQGAGPQLAVACRAVAPCPPGEARLTRGFELRARAVIHAVGPVWRGGQQGERDVLTSAYAQSLELAAAHGLESIAFPAISTGIYGYPLEEASTVAVAAVQAFVRENELPRRVLLVAFDESTELALRDALGEN